VCHLSTLRSCNGESPEIQGWMRVRSGARAGRGYLPLLTLSGAKARQFQPSLGPSGLSGARFRVHRSLSRSGKPMENPGAKPWRRLATAHLGSAPTPGWVMAHYCMEC